MEVNHNDSGLRPDELINVKINKTLDAKRDFNVTVNFFYEALQFHKKVGKTVMSMTFIKKNKNGTLSFDSYDNGTKGGKTCYNNTLNLTLASQELDFKIEAIFNKRTNTTGFNVTFNDVYMCAYMDGLPPWAVHYITIETINVELRSAPNITCIPKQRCIRPSNRTDIYVQDGKFVKKDAQLLPLPLDALCAVLVLAILARLMSPEDILCCKLVSRSVYQLISANGTIL
uniref:Uncharacterized protein n=1 Tax=Globodera rostochiensis TaxID=31243 RepID=A0A914HU25_GLORO